ncbi:MAG: hypothetical protein QM756_16500 [Polyangiaceae bacterium]
MTKLHEVMLSDDAARFAAAEVAAGRFVSMDEALTAGVEALRSREELQAAWVELVRARVRDGRAAYARGDLPETTPDEYVDEIARELGLAP